MVHFLNQILLGKNIDYLRQIESNSIHLIYADPPYYTNRKFDDFDDTFPNMQLYLKFMEPIIKEIYRIITENGFFVLQCDWHSDGYLRVLCDSIFGYENLINHIIWKRTDRVKPTAKTYGKCTDSIFIYSKSEKSKLKVCKKKLSINQIDKYYSKIEKETGRRYNTSGMIKKGNSPKKLRFPNGKTLMAPEGMRWGWNQETLDQKLRENPFVLEWNGEYPRSKIYLDEHIGIPMTNLWDDIGEITTSSNERCGYSTQKPKKLLKRIILSTTNENDIVLDPFCGSETTCVVAKELNRNYIGIDKNPLAIQTTNKRIKNTTFKIKEIHKSRRINKNLLDFLK